MTTDALAKRLRVLLEEGSIASSRLSRRARKELSSLFDTRILVEQRVGGGRSVVVESRAGLKEWIARQYPHGLDGYQGRLPARATGVANLRDSKRGSRRKAALIQLRGFEGARLQSDDEDFPVAHLTRKFGAASLLIDQAPPWQFDGCICTVENLEAFLQIEQIVDDIDIAIFADGRLPRQVVSWLASSNAAEATVVHAGDYDPTGLAEYLRLRRALGERATLFVPPDLERLIDQYGNAKLLRDSRGKLDAVRQSDDPDVLEVVRILDRYGRALEQEALFIGASPAATDDAPHAD